MLVCAAFFGGGSVQIIYQGVDITDRIDVRKCVCRDESRERCDSLELQFDHIDRWTRWHPEKDDRIEVRQDGYSSGVMYLNSIIPESHRYRMVATALPVSARTQAWKSYRNVTLSSLMADCAAQCGMTSGLYGVSAGLGYPYIERRNESCAAFLERVLNMEGAVLKCCGGKFSAIGILYAQGRPPARTIEIDEEQKTAQYHRNSGRPFASLSIKTPYASATARDSAAGTIMRPVLSGMPACNSGQAGRWARGLLLFHNRLAERLVLECELDLGLTAMVRVDVTGQTSAVGSWLVDSAEHDLYNSRTVVKLVKCLSTVS